MQLGVLVDYLTRLMLTHDVKSSFDISMTGLQLLESIDLLDEKKALDELAIVNPRLNQLFTYSLTDVNQESLKKLARNMGY